jgi:hypothetical protein
MNASLCLAALSFPTETAAFHRLRLAIRWAGLLLLQSCKEALTAWAVCRLQTGVACATL